MIKLFILFTLSVFGSAVFDIQMYGAVPHSDTIKDQFQNQKAFMQAVKAANASLAQRIVRIPTKTFYSMPVLIQNVNNLKIQILGKISASKSVKFWPREEGHRHRNFIQINNCSNIQISGGGRVDGRGYHWWILVFENNKKLMNNQDDRPHMFNLVGCENIKIHDLILKNSATFHIKLDHCHNAEIFNLDIKVNTTAQFNLLKKLSLEGSIAMFPFNTDGIDPSGGNMHIYNLTVQNFDDVVVPKPSHDDDCTQNMLVQNIQVRLGVGMSIGSVPPHQGGACIRNITFQNVYMKRPFKGIYVKTNPGTKGWGNITDIYYKNITMDRPIWWAIYIGPQQMREPGGAGPGCMLYPFDKKGTCSTQPRVTLKNITLQDITIHKSLLYPVTVRCNVSNPCTQINFFNVKTDSWQIGQKQKGVVCQFASGKSHNCSPKIDCLDGQVQEEQTNKKILKIQKTEQEEDGFIRSIETFFEQNRDKSILSIYQQLVSMTVHKKDKHRLIISRVVQQIENAIKQIGYEDAQNDQFSYDFDDIEKNDEVFAKLLLNHSVPEQKVLAIHISKL